jgi:uncharacterized membrane protein
VLKSSLSKEGEARLQEALHGEPTPAANEPGHAPSA